MEGIEKENLLKKLDSPSHESLVYIGYFKPKSQRELDMWVYNNHPANITPLIDARVKLSENGWVSPVQGFTGLRKIPQKSSPAPFIEYLRKLSKERPSSRGDEFRLTEDELKYIEGLIDSDFFRETFFGDKFFETRCGIHRSRIYRDEKGKMKVKSALEIIKYSLFSIAIQSICLFDDSFNVRKLYVKNIQDIINRYSKFDNFLTEHLANIQKKNLKDFLLKNPKMKDAVYCFETSSQDKYYLENVVFNGLFLCLPVKLALKIIAVSTPRPLLSFVTVYYGTMHLKYFPGFSWGTPELAIIPEVGVT